MNLIIGEIDWSQIPKKNTIQKTKFSNDILSLKVERIHNFISDELNIYVNPNTGMLCAILGYIANLEKLKETFQIKFTEDVKVVESLFAIKGVDFIKELEGVFTILLFDTKLQSVCIFQDEQGSNIPLYYISVGHKFIFSTCLKELLKRDSFKREINKTAVFDFLFYKTIVPSELTFIKNIYKIIPKKYLTANIKHHKVKLKSWKSRVEKTSKENAKSELINSIGDSVKRLLNIIKTNDLTCTLSGGFDTNLNLHFINQNTEKEITAVTIGGKNIDEIPTARKCIKQYENAIHKHAVVDSDKLNTLPDIVWRLEGYVFEPGIFLQHQLAVLLFKSQKKIVFCGECADQVFNSYRNKTLLSLKYHLKSTFLSFLFFRYIKLYLSIWKEKGVKLEYFRKPHSRIRYDKTQDYIIKKNGIMLNSFGVQGVYPFLNNKTVAMSKSLGKRLNYKKRFYKEQVKKTLGKEKAALLTKIGGSTDIEYLVSSDKIRLVPKLLNSEFIRQFVKPSQASQLIKHPVKYVDIVFQLLYLYLFDKLFISGEYDIYFDEPAMNINLERFFD